MPIPPVALDPIIVPAICTNISDRQAIINKAIAQAKAKTKSEIKKDEDNEKYYYHLTTPEVAASIIAESKLRPGWEGYVYAWDRSPTRRAFGLSGARSIFTTIKFQTNMAFEQDFGNAASYGAVRAARPCIVNIYNASIVV